MSSAAYTPPSIALGAPSETAAKETAGYGFSHTMVRIKDPEVSIRFYRETLGMTLVHTMHSEGGKFTNYFLLYPQSEVPKEEDAKRTWMWSQQGIVELCQNSAGGHTRCLATPLSGHLADLLLTRLMVSACLFSAQATTGVPSPSPTSSIALATKPSTRALATCASMWTRCRRAWIDSRLWESNSRNDRVSCGWAWGDGRF